ncbi:hypothetical protein PC9H_010552 [Pleurotus ostreatus]|uniref:Uncharacterized protein n=1 Tax=Pleurotus ostreatus TaxID=5322 RepID=A0A8H7DM34_PLEOS|nr:uncharacterized protein PC9H_010552 [Pleurotus ostreatus]KAF7422396.1 hypothetical protein PC9H_010552 [Pleurotus ostreatus]
MASKIIGLTVLTNPRTPVANPHVVFFDANFWLADGIQLLGCLRYYNRSRITFDDVEPIPCVIDASIAAMTSQANIDAPELPDSEKKEYQIVGDITWMIPVGEIAPEALQCPPYLYLGGVVKASQKDTGTDTARFDIVCSQWLNAYRHDQRLSKLPVRIFISKTHRCPDPKKICPADDTWVSVQAGRLSKFILNDAGWLTQLDVDMGADGTIAFMGKWTPPFTPIKTPGNALSAGNNGKRRKFSYGSLAERGSPLPRNPAKRSRIENLALASSESSIASLEDTPSMSSVCPEPAA